MKKIICILLSMFIMGTTSFAQDKDAKKPAKAATAGKTENGKARVSNPPKEKGKPAANAAPAATTAATATPAKMKKDGTPDMRAKENKAAAKKSAGPLKKDGTPDMRYKANKDAAASKK